MDRGSTIPLPAFEAQTVRKIRNRIIPLLFVLYVIAYLDRINIGFAALTLNRELAIGSQQFGLLVGIFFFGYFLFEIPSNLLLHKVGARIWIARILISWGTIAVLTGFVHRVAEIYLARFLLGVAEAGFFPGIVLYLTYWFRQKEQAQAIALFMIGLPISSILGAPVSGLILDHIHWLGLGSWRWLLVLEGLPAIACGILTYFLLPSRPAEAGFLTPEEKNWVVSELAREEEQKLAKRQRSAFQALTEGRVWHLAFIGFTMAIGLYSMSFWVPQLVKGFSSRFSNSTVGFLVMVPHLAGLLAMILVSRSSDRKQERRYHTAIPAMVGGTALILLGSAKSPFFLILVLSFLAAGIYSFYPPFFSFPSEFLTGYSAATGIALINSVANLGGFVGPFAIGAVNSRTGSLYGGLAGVGVSLFLSAALVLLLPKQRHPILS